METVKVIVRVRQCTQSLEQNNGFNVVGNVIHLCPKSVTCDEHQNGGDCCNKFTIDRCLIPGKGKDNTQWKISKDIGECVLEDVSAGYNTSVIAVGPKAGGKTHTMIGKSLSLTDSPDFGVIPTVCKNIFSFFENQSDDLYTFSVSFLEVFNEQIHDLLLERTTDGSAPTSLNLLEHPNHGPHVQGLTRYVANKFTDLLGFIEKGNRNRVVDRSKSYESSKSHAVFIINYTQAKFSDNVPKEVFGKILLVDLAYWVQDKSGHFSLDRKNSACINRSLAAFHNIINSLADVMDRRSSRRRSFYLPYRDTALTWLLKECLGGNCLTTLIANINPVENSYAEMMETLKLVSRAKRISNRPTINEDAVAKQIRELLDANKSLRLSLSDCRRSRMYVPMRQFVEIREKLKKNDETIHELTFRWISKWKGAVTSNFFKVTLQIKELVSSWRINSGHSKKRKPRVSSSYSAPDSAFSSDNEQDSRVFSDDCEDSSDCQRQRSNLLLLPQPNGNFFLSPQQPRRRFSTTIHIPISQNSEEEGEESQTLRQQNAEMEPNVQKNVDPYEDNARVKRRQRLSQERRTQQEEFKAELKEKSVNLRKVDTIPPKLEINHPGIKIKLSPVASRKATCSKSQSVLPSSHNFPSENTSPPSHDFRFVNTLPPSHKISSVNHKPPSQGAPCVNILPASHHTTSVQPSHSIPSAHTSALCLDILTVNASTESHRIPTITVLPPTFNDIASDILVDSTRVQQNCGHVEANRAFTNNQESDGIWQPRETSDLLTQMTDEFNRAYQQLSDMFSQQYATILRQRSMTSKMADDVASRLSLARPILDALQKRISENKDSSEKIKSQLDHYRHLSDSMEKIICISNLLGRVESGLEVQDYVEVVEVLQEIKKLLSSSFELEKEVEIKARRVLQVQMCVLKDRMMQEIEDAWNLLICWSLPDRSVTKKTESTTFLLDLSNFLRKKSLVGVLIKAMIRLDLFDCWVRKFCDLLMSNIVDNIVKNRNTLLQISDEEFRHTAKVTVYAMSSKFAVSPLEVFPKLEQIFLFLHRSLSGFDVDATEGDQVSGESPTSLADHVWSVLRKRFFDCVCEWCLSRTFKSSNIDWTTYGQIVLAVERFQDVLAKLGLAVQPGEITLVDYVSMVGKHMNEIKGQELLKKAHGLIVMDLLVMVEVSITHPLGIDLKETKEEEFMRQCKERSGTSNYKLPTCRISIPVRSLTCLAYDTLKEACVGSKQVAVHLGQSLRIMYELFCDLIPFYHREKLSRMPLLAALHHNNCMFLAHHMITIGKTFKLKISDVRGSNDSEDDSRRSKQGSVVDLQDLVTKLKRMGNEEFGRFIESQRQQLINHLSQAKGFSCIADDDGRDAMKSIENILHTLKHVSGVWRDVLPVKTYCKAIGSLLDEPLKEIIRSVISITEFSVEDCEQLQRVLHHLLEKNVDFFRMGNEVNTSLSFNAEVMLQESVSSWMKFRELVAFLGYDLSSLSDRWADGKGPLAMHFLTEEVAVMTVAMFEKTAKRDGFLTQLGRNPSVYKK